MFLLDPNIDRDSVLITTLGLSQLRLQNDLRSPWIILVPEINGITEVHELTVQQQNTLIAESSLVSNVLKNLSQCKKINVANLGNVVAQLHWHIVARSENDETWPGPIWGVGKSIPYPDKKRAEFIDSFLKVLNQERD